jgi:hypothetical protein
VSNKQLTTEVVHGNEKIVDRFVQFLQNAQRSIDICVDNTWLLLVVVFTYIGDNIAYQHGLHFCQEVYPYRNQNKV